MPGTRPDFTTSAAAAASVPEGAAASGGPPPSLFDRYAVLLSTLAEAEASAQAGEDRLLASLRALHAVNLFLAGDPHANTAGVNRPLSRLALAIRDRIKGGKPELLFKSCNDSSRTAGAPANMSIEAAKGTLAEATELLIRRGYRRRQAAGIVGAEAKKILPKGSLRNKATPAAILRWRDEIRARASPLLSNVARDIASGCGFR